MSETKQAKKFSRAYILLAILIGSLYGLGVGLIIGSLLVEGGVLSFAGARLLGFISIVGLILISWGVIIWSWVLARSQKQNEP